MNNKQKCRKLHNIIWSYKSVVNTIYIAVQGVDEVVYI